MDKNQEKWYFKGWSLTVSFLFVGPLMLPLVWLNPAFSRRKKITITAIIIILTCAFALVLLKSLKNLENYYQFMQNEIY